MRHPDKHPESTKQEAEARFKEINQVRRRCCSSEQQEERKEEEEIEMG